MDPQIDTITLGVTDLSRAAQFYEDGFAFRVRQTAGECLTLGLGGSSSLELCPWDELARDAGVSPETSGFRGFTLSYIVEQAADVDATLTRLVHFGGEISKAPKFAFWGYSGHVTDPSGHLWKIASPKRRPLRGAKRAANGLVDPIEPQELALTIGVDDMKRAKQFYEDGLGNSTKKSYAKFVSFDGGTGAPDLAMYKWDALADDADVPAAGNGFRGFRISHRADSSEAVTTLLDRAKRAGAKIVGPARDDHAAYFSDPDGYLWKVAART